MSLMQGQNLSLWLSLHSDMKNVHELKPNLIRKDLLPIIVNQCYVAFLCYMYMAWQKLGCFQIPRHAGSTSNSAVNHVALKLLSGIDTCEFGGLARKWMSRSMHTAKLDLESEVFQPNTFWTWDTFSMFMHMCYVYVLDCIFNIAVALWVMLTFIVHVCLTARTV